MSEYQYYEFLAIDRPLDEQQQAELRTLSTRAQITATSFTNEYHWGDFRGSPRTMMERYFDAFLYVANWGTRHLMIRLPRRLLAPAEVERYCSAESGDAVTAWASGDHVILSLFSDDDRDYYWEDGAGWLASIAHVRSELAAGDLRLLYLAWLLSVQAGEVEDDEVEPPVPPSLRTLSAPLRATVDFLGIDEDLFAVAATASPEVPHDRGSQPELATWIEGLPPADKDQLLMQAAQGEAAQVQAILQRRFHTERSPAEATYVAGRRTAAHLWKEAGALYEQRKRAEAERLAQERARKARAAAAAYERRLDDLALRREHAWQQVSELIDTKKPREYDQAVAILKDLRALGEREGHVETFLDRFRQLREQHHRKPSLLERFDAAGLEP